MKRILIKIGTSSICKNNHLDRHFIKKKSYEISDLIKQDNEIILLSSGAVAAGMEVENRNKRPLSITYQQALAGKGQPRLVQTYEKYFKDKEIDVAQILLTHHNFSTEEEKQNIRDVIEIYLENKRLTIPILNTNDPTTKEELMGDEKSKYSDNDSLGALVASNLDVDLYLILTDIEGLFRNYNKTNQELVQTIYKITPEIESLVQKELNGNSLMNIGGMYSKIQAAKKLQVLGIETKIAHNKYQLKDILENKVPHTTIKSL